MNANMTTPMPAAAENEGIQLVQKRKVLFVDDDPALLHGLRRMLHDKRDVWSMDFESSGAEALRKVDSWNPDVVVTDMRMPGMSGAQLLKEVRQKNPGILRIVLSGQSDWRTTLSSSDDAQQVLSKPCDQGQLKDAINLSQRLDAMVADQALRGEVARLSRLPMVEPVVRQLLDEMDSPTGSPKRVASLIEGDAALSAKVLKKVHSSDLALPVRVKRPSQAALLLGFDHLRSLALSAESMHFMGAGIRVLAEGLSKQASKVAKQARLEAEGLGGEDSDAGEAFTAAMLHDIGILVLATLRPEKTRTWMLANPEGWPGNSVEEAYFGATHAAVGAYLLALWGLPERLVRAVECHHRDDISGGSIAATALRNALNELAAKPLAA